MYQSSDNALYHWSQYILRDENIPDGCSVTSIIQFITHLHFPSVGH